MKAKRLKAFWAMICIIIVIIPIKGYGFILDVNTDEDYKYSGLPPVLATYYKLVDLGYSPSPPPMEVVIDSALEKMWYQSYGYGRNQPYRYGQSYYPSMYQQPYNPYDPYRGPLFEDGYRPPPDFSNWIWTDPWTAYDPSGRGAAAVNWQPEYLGTLPYFQQTGYQPYNYNTPYTLSWNQPYGYRWNQPYTSGGWSPYSLLYSYYPSKYSPVGYLSPTYYTTDYIDADVKINGDDDEDSITLEVGETLSVTLQTTEAAYMSYTYTWELDTGELDTAVVRQVAEYLPSKSSGPHHHEFVFKARDVGTTIIRIENTSPDNETWVPPFGNTFEIGVTVVED